MSDEMKGLLVQMAYLLERHKAKMSTRYRYGDYELCLSLSTNETVELEEDCDGEVTAAVMREAAAGKETV
jgi:hypothetical protein